ncbi:MAG: hypothetical protein ABIQ73_30790 [Acidimicrobiales bacterium]
MTASTLLRYRMCSLEVHSEIALVELDRADDNVPATCVVQLGKQAPATIARWLLDHEHREGFLAKEDPEQRLVVHLEGAAIIVVGADNATIVVHPEIDDEDVISHLVVDHVLPRVLARRGYTVLHATCVAYQDRAVAFVGASGAGKSTLAMSAVHSGARLLADDCLVLADCGAEFEVLASYAGSRLWSDSASALDIDPHGALINATGKSRVRLDAAFASGTRTRLAAVFVLERDATDLDIDAMAPAEAFWRLGENTYVFDGRRHGFDGLGSLVDTTPIYRLRYPSSYASLPAVHRAISQLIESI